VPWDYIFKTKRGTLLLNCNNNKMEQVYLSSVLIQ